MTTTAPNNLPSDSVDAIHRSPATGVTVVIPTFNRSADVQRALANLWVQQGVAVDVIVVDNSSTDGTADMVAQQQQQVWGERLRYLRKAPEGPASARNLGVRQATTPYVLFHDSDVELSPNWVQHAIAYLDQEPRLGAVGGHIVYAFEPSRVNAYGGDLGWFGLAWDVSEGEPLSAQTGRRNASGSTARPCWCDVRPCWPPGPLMNRFSTASKTPTWGGACGFWATRFVSSRL